MNRRLKWKMVRFNEYIFHIAAARGAIAAARGGGSVLGEPSLIVFVTACTDVSVVFFRSSPPRYSTAPPAPQVSVPAFATDSGTAAGS
jgi:hypothetical protein